MPYSRKIPNTGRIHTIKKDIHQGQGSRSIPLLLDEIVKEFAKSSKNYIEMVGEAPYSLGEMQLSGLIVPALVKNADAFLSECPIIRKKKKKREGTFGRVDFWIRYKGFDLFLEVKHDYDAFNTDRIRESVQLKWDEANNFQNSRIKEYAKETSLDPDKVYTISLTVVTIYKKDKNEQINPSFELEKLVQIQQRYFEFLDNPKPNWSALWQVDHDLVAGSYLEKETSYEYYPAVMFLAKVQKI